VSDYTAEILAEVARAKTRDGVVAVYAQAIASWRDSTDWSRVNEAIMTRWSKAGLAYIKAQAWKVGGSRASWSASPFGAVEVGYDES
jgi:hypothetical protein